MICRLSKRWKKEVFWRWLERHVVLYGDAKTSTDSHKKGRTPSPTQMQRPLCILKERLIKEILKMMGQLTIFSVKISGHMV